MTETVRTEIARLPSAVVSLLDRYGGSHGTEPRLWRRVENDWVCVYPEGFGATDGPPGPRANIEIGERQYVLELVGGGDGALAFLVDAVRQTHADEEEARSAAHELSERYEEINLLYSIAEILASFLSMEKSTTRILEEVTDVLGARRAALWVADVPGNALILGAAVGDEGLAGPIPIDDENSLTARVFRERQPINLERGDRIARGTLQEPRPQGEEPYLSVPVSFTPPDGGSRTIGVITLVGRRTEVRFSAGDLKLLTAVASQVGAALETQRLLRESVRRQRIERELELAHDLQLKLLPDASRFQHKARVAARCAPAESVGGDLYHLFEMSGGRFGVVVGDVSGHGFTAALIMAVTISAIAIYAQEESQPGDVLRRVHQAIIDELESTEMYLTILFAVIDPAEGTVRYSNAGHPHGFLIGADGAVDRLDATTPPLGTVALPEYGESERSWDLDALLLLFTDGLSDAFSGDAGINGEQQLVAEVVAMRDREPADIIEHLFHVAESSNPQVPPDDRTAVLVRG